MEYKWVHSSAYSSIPQDAVPGGNDTDGAIIYVGRSFHNGDMLVAKVMPSKHIAFVSWRGEEVPKDHFEILCGTNLAWRHCYDHVIPENAVLCGKTSLEQPIYVGRGWYEGSLTVGKISSVHRALFIPFGGAERRLNSYEILVEETKSIGWSLPTPPPPEPIIEKANPPLIELLESKPYPYPPMLESKPSVPFVPVPAYDPPPPYAPIAPSVLPPPPPTPVFTPANVAGATSYDPYLPSKPGYTTAEFKPATPYDPYLPPKPGYTPAEVAPPNSYVPPPTFTPAQVAPPTPIRTHDLWVAASYNYTPPNAVHAGHDTDLSTLLVCRAFHCGEMLPGKGVPNRGCAYISHAGQEITKSNYEILVGDRYHWVSSGDGNVPPGAVEAGRTMNGEPLYVGRAHYCGSLTPGRIQCSHRCLYIPYGGREVRVTHYEALVRSDEFYRGQGMLY
ncbi:uncharacterized protein LOC119679635 isoform X1 [Teleopsis dalmanni]|uniref:uncharacterized protein LOC119679635 isoform X1 n=1 Tax=Teleopsis dalmanni TaxID=139649 RepID=UPI0018CCF37C|nr:uncharacterized protein LOC119679635 isoform X1 [Teleopsis dalmanni]